MTIRRLLAAILLVLAGGLAACGADDATDAVDDGPRTHTIVIPQGTTARQYKGEKVTLMPARIEFRVGDTLHIVNEDFANQTVGPYLIRAGSEFEITYGAPGRYEGVCYLTEGDRYEIVVRE